MITIAVRGGAGSPVLRQLQRLTAGRAVRVVPESALAGRADILVALGRAAPGSPPTADILVAAGPVAGEAARGCPAATLVTVGLDPRDTVTPSSMLGPGMATLQREVACPGGLVLPQELDLRGLQGSLDVKMALAATLLMLGPEP